MSQDIRAAKLALLYNQIPTAMLAELACAFITALVLRDTLTRQCAILWIVFIGINILWRFGLLRQYRHALASHSFEFWLRWFALGVLLSGMAWGYIAGAALPIAQGFNQLFLVMVLLGITAAASTYYSVFPGVYYLFLLPAVLPYTFWLVRQEGEGIFLSICTIVYIIAMSVSSRYLHRWLNTSLELRFENLDLDTSNVQLERMVAERTDALEESLAIANATLESSEFGVMMVDDNQQLTYFNMVFTQLWQISPEVMKHYSHMEHIAQVIRSKLIKSAPFDRLMQQIEEKERQEFWAELACFNGAFLEAYVKVHQRRNGSFGHIWQFRDITVRKRMEQQLAHQASHDALTQLPNRVLLYDRIEQAISYAQRFRATVSIMFLDIDNFKIINDSLGHNVGDELLCEIARRLRAAVRRSDSVARFGGDEFVIVHMNARPSEVAQMASQILQALKKNITIENHDFQVTCSIGVCTYPYDGQDVTTLLKNADMAMYHAKRLGKNNYQQYSSGITEHAERRLILQNKLNKAIQNNELHLVYQPLVEIKTDQLVGVEVLLRWVHPEIGIITPTEFVPVAEESGYIVELGEWVLHEACKQGVAWRTQGLKNLRLSVNISTVQIKHSNFTSMLEDIMKRYELADGYLELELTESNFMENNLGTREILAYLNKLGVDFVIDDFGTGYSNLNYLKKFPVDKIKIDRSFIKDCIHNQNDASIVEAIIAMGHSLKLKVVAEGVENLEQLHLLKRLGCDVAQGYYFSEPISAEDFTDWVLRWQRSMPLH